MVNKQPPNAPMSHVLFEPLENIHHTGSNIRFADTKKVVLKHVASLNWNIILHTVESKHYFSSSQCGKLLALLETRLQGPSPHPHRRKTQGIQK